MFYESLYSYSYRLVQAELISKVKSRKFSGCSWEIPPEILHTCSVSPCQPVYGRFFFLCFFRIFRQMFGRLFVLGYLGLNASQGPGQKIKTKTLFVDGSTGTQHMRKKSGAISKKRREHLGFCAENMRNLLRCLENFLASV